MSFNLRQSKDTVRHCKWVSEPNGTAVDVSK